MPALKDEDLLKKLNTIIGLAELLMMEVASIKEKLDVKPLSSRAEKNRKREEEVKRVMNEWAAKRFGSK